jgi:hypothetical protein
MEFHFGRRRGEWDRRDGVAVLLSNILVDEIGPEQRRDGKSRVAPREHGAERRRVRVGMFFSNIIFENLSSVRPSYQSSMTSE